MGAGRWGRVGTFKRQERALWFVLGALVGGIAVAAFLLLFEVRHKKRPSYEGHRKPGNL